MGDTAKDFQARSSEVLILMTNKEVSEDLCYVMDRSGTVALLNESDIDER